VVVKPREKKHGAKRGHESEPGKQVEVSMTMGRLLKPRRIFLLVMMWVVSQSWITSALAATGAEDFTRLCSACHTVGGGKRVGPDLQGVNDRRSADWLVKWIATPQAMVNSGDPTAVALFKEYNIPMPDTALSADEIRGILDYIRGASGGAPAQPAAPAPVRAANPEDARRGRELFQGGTTLANGGPACTSCHHVAHKNVIGGGVLAKELTGAFTRLGAAGLQAILHAPPFPVMQEAYKDRPITDQEIAALNGYLQSVSESGQSFDQRREDSMKLLFGGLVGLTVLMCLYSLTWRRRKKDPVNQRVFDRQVSSQ